MKDLLQCVYKSLQLIDVLHTKKSISTFLENHQDTYSLLCLSDLFDSYNIENTAGEFEDKAELLNYPGAHISQLIENETAYFVVVKTTTKKTIIYHKEGKKITEPLEEYFKKWQGYALFFTRKPESAEPNYAENKKAERIEKFKVFLFALATIAVISGIIYTCLPIILPATFIGLAALKAIGVIVSILLLSYTYNSENPVLKGICNVGKKVSCGNILSSKAAKVFSFLSWSEVGLFYFLTTLITLLISEIQQQPSGYYLLVGLNMLALPYTIYSVYHQKKVAKTWCVMCLSVQALLVMEFVTGITLWKSFSMQNIISSGFTMLISGIFVITAWYLIKPLLQANTDLKVTKKDLKKFKRNLPLFHFTLNNQTSLSYPKQAEILQFGSQNPKIQFTVFTSPACTHCSKAHVVINNLLSKYPSEIAFVEIFAISNDERDERVKIAAHMLQLYKKQTKEFAHKAINEWHTDESRNAEKWMAKFPVDGDAINENKEIIGMHNYLAKSLGIHQTPMIVINGKLMPDLYRVEDLESIIPAYLSAISNN